MKRNLWLYFMYIHFRIGQFVSDSVRDFRTDDDYRNEMYGSNSGIDSKRFLSLEGGQKSEAMMCESYSLQPLWEKILHFLMNESIEEEQKEIKQLQVNLYTVFEKNLEDHFLHLNVKRWECGKIKINIIRI